MKIYVHNRAEGYFYICGCLSVYAQLHSVYTADPRQN